MASGDISADSQAWLLCRVGARLCGLPLGHVVETMRMLPIAAIAGAPPFVCGLCTIRGSPVPVVAAAALFGDSGGSGRRLVQLEVGGRAVALAVDAVVGVRRIAAETRDRMPPLLGGAAADAVAAIAVRDGELLLLLESARLVPEPGDASDAARDAA